MIDRKNAFGILTNSLKFIFMLQLYFYYFMFFLQSSATTMHYLGVIQVLEDVLTHPLLSETKILILTKVVILKTYDLAYILAVCQFLPEMFR